MSVSNVKKIEVFHAPDGYRWRAKAANGEIVATGEGHTTERDAQRAATGVFPDPSITMVVIDGTET